MDAHPWILNSENVSGTGLFTKLQLIHKKSQKAKSSMNELIINLAVFSVKI